MEPIPVTPVPPLAPPRGNEKAWAIFCHLSSFVGLPLLLPFVVYLAMKDDSDYARANAREALNFHLSLLIYGLCCVPLIFLGIGVLLLGAMALALIVLSIVGAIKAADGGCYHYPLTIQLAK